MDKWAKPGNLAVTKTGQKRTGRDTTDNSKKKPRLPADDLNGLVVQTAKLALATAKTVRLRQGALVSTVLLEHSNPVCVAMEANNAE
eukprot:1090339-Heterocapsa_arctica.AAC.1